MFNLEDEDPTPGYWPSVSDLFITLFIITIAILAAVFFALLPKNNVASEKAVIVAVGQDLGKIRTPTNELRKVLGLPRIRPTQNPDEVMIALEETCSKACDRIRELESKINTLSQEPSRKKLADLQAENRDLKTKLEKLRDDTKKLRNILRGVGVETLIAENKNLRRLLHDQPPNIQFSEQKKDYNFGSGSSSMGAKFIEGLRKNEFKQLADEIVARQDKGRVKVDTLEIVGHTDGKPFSRGGNLDQGLPEVLAGKRKISSLTPGSNNDLGLLRALAVRRQWEAFIDEHQQADVLRSVEVRCYSAGQTILPASKAHPKATDYMQDDKRARRIEMRLTRLKSDTILPANQ